MKQDNVMQLWWFNLLYRCGLLITCIGLVPGWGPCRFVFVGKALLITVIVPTCELLLADNILDGVRVGGMGNICDGPSRESSNIHGC